MDSARCIAWTHPGASRRNLEIWTRSQRDVMSERIYSNRFSSCDTQNARLINRLTYRYVCVYIYIIYQLYIYTHLLYIYPDLQRKLEADENSQAVKKKLTRPTARNTGCNLYLSIHFKTHDKRNTVLCYRAQIPPLCPGRTSACGREIDLQSTLDRPGIRNSKHFISLYRKSEDVEIERTHGISTLGVCRLWKLGHGSLQCDIVYVLCVCRWMCILQIIYIYIYLIGFWTSRCIKDYDFWHGLCLHVLYDDSTGNCHFTTSIHHDTSTRQQPISSTPPGAKHSSPALQALPTCSRCASTECGPPGKMTYHGPWCNPAHKKSWFLWYPQKIAWDLTNGPLRRVLELFNTQV